VTKGAWMPSSIFLSIFLFFFTLMALSFFLQRRKRKNHERLAAADESSLWVGLAAGLFDSADSPASARLEIALGAVAHRLKMRAGIITIGGKGQRRVLAVTGTDSSLTSGLEEGSVFRSDSTYCGSIAASGQLLAIDYASLSEWRRHAACREMGWECYLGLSCGDDSEESVVVAFFDTFPREHLFSIKEKALVEHLGPWIASMVALQEFTGARRAGFVYPESTTSFSGEA